MNEKQLSLGPFTIFLTGIVKNFAIGCLIIAFSLSIGMAGYHHFEKMSWVDAYVNAAMILSGMGPVDQLKTEAGKIFAGSYALFSGIIFLVVIAIIIAPLLKRFLHKFHLDQAKMK
jgi:hypothetical protein